MPKGRPDRGDVRDHLGRLLERMATSETSSRRRSAQQGSTAGARRAILLPVSAPFHCALMRPAQERLKLDLDATAFADLACPLINNWEAREIRTGAEAREGVYQQVSGAPANTPLANATKR